MKCARTSTCYECKKDGLEESESEVERPLFSQSSSLEAMIVSSCYTRRNGVIRFKKTEREVEGA